MGWKKTFIRKAVIVAKKAAIKGQIELVKEPTTAPPVPGSMYADARVISNKVIKTTMSKTIFFIMFSSN